MSSPLELSAYRLPKPVVVRELDYDAQHDKRRQQFRELWDKLQQRYPDLPDYDTLLLETDPSTKLLELAAFADMLFVGELNDTARVVRLVQFAEGRDLELHAAEQGLERRAGELDPELRQRVITRRRGSSAAGSDDWYRWHALGASPDVAEVDIDDSGGLVDVAVRSKVGDGVPSAELLDQVRAVLTSRAVRVRGIRVRVSPAVPRPINITARVMLDHDAIDPVFGDVYERFPGTFNGHVRIGRDITRSWLIAALSAPGVKSVELIEPAADVVIAPNELATLGAVSITKIGRGW